MAIQKISLETVKRLCLIALASDDLLLEMLVLKGGNAIDLLQNSKPGSLSRASYDLDFSIASDFEDNLDEVNSRIEIVLEMTFAEQGLIVFDYRFSHKPKAMRDELKDFWGGYYIEFKLITSEEFKRLDANLEKIRRSSIPIRPDQSRRVEIEISKYEYVGDKVEVQIDGHAIYTYSPQMIVFEKIRAICQQHPDYAKVVPSHSHRPRARDFYDIHLIADQHTIKTDSTASQELLKLIFEAKKVPLTFIAQIAKHADIHRGDWQNVIDTLPTDEKENIKPFDYYLEFVIGLCKPFTSL